VELLLQTRVASESCGKVFLGGHTSNHAPYSRGTKRSPKRRPLFVRLAHGETVAGLFTEQMKELMPGCVAIVTPLEFMCVRVCVSWFKLLPQLS